MSRETAAASGVLKGCPTRLLLTGSSTISRPGLESPASAIAIIKINVSHSATTKRQGRTQTRLDQTAPDLAEEPLLSAETCLDFDTGLVTEDFIRVGLAFLVGEDETTPAILCALRPGETRLEVRLNRIFTFFNSCSDTSGCLAITQHVPIKHPHLWL